MRSLSFIVAAISMACGGIPQYSKTINFTDTPSNPDNYQRIRAGAQQLGCTPKQQKPNSETFHCKGNLVVFRESRTDEGVLTGNVSVYCQNLSDKQCSDLANDIMTAGGVVSR